MADFSELNLNFTLKELTFSSDSERADVPGSSSTVELRDDRLVCVEYPAVVTSVDDMLETLGGEPTVSKVRQPCLQTVSTRLLLFMKTRLNFILLFYNISLTL